MCPKLYSPSSLCVAVKPFVKPFSKNEKKKNRTTLANNMKKHFKH